MVNKLNRLTAQSVATATKAGRHADGGNLYLKIDKSGAKRWVFFYKLDGRQREAGLGSVHSISLAKAREIAAGMRELLAQGLDPLDARQADRRAKAARVTFGECADALLASKASGWRNQKHGAQWTMTLKVYAAPLRPLPVAEVSTQDVLKVLQPLWLEKPETASRLRGRIEAVLDAARTAGHIDDRAPNPARSAGHLEMLLPRPAKLARPSSGHGLCGAARVHDTAARRETRNPARARKRTGAASRQGDLPVLRGYGRRIRCGGPAPKAAHGSPDALCKAILASTGKRLPGGEAIRKTIRRKQREAIFIRQKDVQVPSMEILKTLTGHSRAQLAKQRMDILAKQLAEGETYYRELPAAIARASTRRRRKHVGPEIYSRRTKERGQRGVDPAQRCACGGARRVRGESCADRGRASRRDGLRHR